MIILIALNLKDYSDSDWARDVDDRNSITSFFFLHGRYNIHMEFKEAIYNHFVNT